MTGGTKHSNEPPLACWLAFDSGTSGRVRQESTDQVTEEFAWNAAATDMEAPGETYAVPLLPLAEIYPWNPTLQTAATIPQADVNRKLIKNVWLTAETEDFDGLMAGVTSRISQLGGYVKTRRPTMEAPTGTPAAAGRT